MSESYSIGLDYGTLSCRGIIADISDGTVVTEAEYVYPAGVMSRSLPDGEPLPSLYALQDPDDYVNALKSIVPTLMKQSRISPDKIKAIGIDATSSTVIPVDSNFIPLCKLEKFRNNRHAWPKLWKHHASAYDAKLLTDKAKELCPEILEDYGGIIGPENFLPKVMQTCREAPEVFEAAETFIEYSDYITSLLAGKEIRSGATLSCKATWSPGRGYPDKEFFRAINPIYENIPDKLMYHNGASPLVVWPGEYAGKICMEMADKLGLSENTIVTAPEMDAYAGIPGAGINSEGSMILMIGTSTGVMLLNKEKKTVPGICAMVENSILPGYTNYAHGLPCVGDLFGWFIKNCVPKEYYEAAEKEGSGIHDYLSRLASEKAPGETGIVALEWWNGEKLNPDLSGLILGMDLNTRPEDIYRALIEATAFGTRRIIEQYRKYGVVVNSVIACGGIAIKNAFLVQLYADVLGLPVKVCRCTQTAALGAAMFAASAMENNRNIEKIIEKMAPENYTLYLPDCENNRKYDKLYSYYARLNELFSHENSIMAELKEIRNEGIK